MIWGLLGDSHTVQMQNRGEPWVREMGSGQGFACLRSRFYLPTHCVSPEYCGVTLYIAWIITHVPLDVVCPFLQQKVLVLVWLFSHSSL